MTGVISTTGLFAFVLLFAFAFAIGQIVKNTRKSADIAESRRSPAGWYPDPTGRYEYRWWDARSWTPTVGINGQTLRDPDPKWVRNMQSARQRQPTGPPPSKS